MRYILVTVFACLVLSACAQNPNDGGQYYNNLEALEAEAKAQEARLAQAENVATPIENDVATTSLDATPAPAPETQALPATVVTDGAISNSQDFETVIASETIESDAAKRERLKSEYEVVQPDVIPQRESGVNLAKYALSQTNPVGNKMYSRNILRRAGYERRCKKHFPVDEAQTAFLNAGGPERDSLGLDPDGDGYACGWNPATYRSLIGQ